MLAARMPDWDFVNAGVNSELAYNLAERLDEIVALDPDAVTVLIGTNDVNATFGFSTALGYIATDRLPERPSPLFYRENLTAIVRRLKKETRARIAVFSIPPIGEEPGHYAYLRTEEYAEIGKSIAKEENVEYLPLRERMCAYIEALPPRQDGPLPFRKIGYALIRSHNARTYLGKSLDEVSASNGFSLLVEGIHLNTHGASMVADLAEAFLREAPRRPGPIRI
jgi:lysophospholipase L1-like esterase